MMTQEQSYMERKLPSTKLLALDGWELKWLMDHVANDIAWITEQTGTSDITDRLDVLWDKLIRSKDR